MKIGSRDFATFVGRDRGFLLILIGFLPPPYLVKFILSDRKVASCPMEDN